MGEKRVENVSAFDAKTRLSELLRRTEQGASFVISRRGRPVARLVPPELPKQVEWEDLKQRLRDLRGRVSRRGPIDVLELIREGRRY